MEVENFSLCCARPHSMVPTRQLKDGGWIIEVPPCHCLSKPTGPFHCPHFLLDLGNNRVAPFEKEKQPSSHKNIPTHTNQNDIRIHAKGESVRGCPI
jgi:hypothetical protein